MPAAPSLRWLSDPAEATAELRSDLTVCWRDVANSGGAVGFAELLPVSAEDVAPVVEEIVAGLDPRLSRLLIATRDDDLAGWLLLTGNANPVIAHWGRVTRLQTALPARGAGVARALMSELHRSARDDLGLGPPPRGPRRLGPGGVLRTVRLGGGRCLARRAAVSAARPSR